jgi:hypothetical protein
MTSAVMSMCASSGPLAGREIRCPPAVAETCLEHFATDLQESSQLASAEQVGAIADEELIVVAGTFAVEAPGTAVRRDWNWLIVHDPVLPRFEELLNSPRRQPKRYSPAAR